MTRTTHRGARWQAGRMLAALAVAAAMLVPVGGLADAASAADPAGGGTILFIRNDNGTSSGFGIDPLDPAVQAPVPLPAKWGAKPWSELSPSPDGSRVAYTVDVQGGGVDGSLITDGSLFVSDFDGSNVIEVATGVNTSAHQITWSPDSSTLAFMLSTTSPDGVSLLSEEIFKVKADGTGRTQLTSSGTYSYSPSWSPDSSRIAFVTSIKVLRTMDTSGGNVVTVATAPRQVFDPVWSPSGDRIAYIDTGAGGSDLDEAYVVPAGGGTSTLVTGGISGASWGVHNLRGTNPWSPDGTMLIVRADGQFPGEEFPRNQYVVRADGGGTPALISPGAGLSTYVTPLWSPDGTRVVFSGGSWGGTITEVDIYTANPDGSNVTKLTSGDYAVVYDWVSTTLSVGDPVVGLVDPTQGLWHLFDDAGAEVSSFFFGNPGDFPIVGDWNCDGVETPGMYRQSDGYVYLRNSNTQGAADIRFFFGDPGDVPIAGDFNKDGCDTVSIYRPSSQTFFIINALGANDGGLGAAEFSYVFGDPGDKPFVGDFDGDGVETVGLHRESTGLVYFRNSHTQGVADAQFIFGDPGDRLIAGDWNGDGKFSPALFRPANTTMYFRYTNTQGNADNQFIPAGSGASWLPVAGIFN